MALNVPGIHLSCLLRAFIIAWVFVSVSHASEGKGRRVALVIGNGNNQQADLPKLPNPLNDAEDISKVLRGFGFEVIERKNLTLEGMNRAIAEFGSRIGSSEAALFYFAGHGIQVKNQNYLIPVDAKMENEVSVPYQGINLNQVLDEMDNAKSSTNIVMLDACRNNPISGRFRSGRTRGLASPSDMPKGTVIVYATAPGNVAADGEGRNGLFTSGLLTAFKGKDLSLDGVLTVASAVVEQASGQAQTPYVNGPKTLQKSFNFGITIDPGRGEIERTFWSSIVQSSDVADFEAYLRQYPNGSFKALAENRLKALMSTHPSSSVPASTTAQIDSTTAFDGRWVVTLVCEDATIKGNLIRGYTFNFIVDVKDGRLYGEKGQVGQPGSLQMLGTIQPDGTVNINAAGRTANPEMSAGNVSPGTSYSYRMHGVFAQSSGKASRIDLRPCEATFLKN
jgi:hypothetical protein